MIELVADHFSKLTRRSALISHEGLNLSRSTERGKNTLPRNIPNIRLHSHRKLQQDLHASGPACSVLYKLPHAH